MSKQSEIEKQEAIAYLKELLHPGDTVYTSLAHVSRSGMYRVINLYVMKDNQPVKIDWWVAKLQQGYDERWEGCKAGGCGMDMGFALVYNLSYVLFNNYDCIGDYPSCPSPDHVNHYPEGCREFKHHTDGYALKQRWM
jgi:hypothetical protein